MSIATIISWKSSETIHSRETSTANLINKGRSGARILCVGNDRSLLEIRRLVLEQAGHSVNTVSGFDLSTQHAVQSIVVAIICHSVYEPYRSQIIAWIQRNLPRTHILLLTPFGDSDLVHEDIAVSSTRPHQLLKCVADLFTGASD